MELEDLDNLQMEEQLIGLVQARPCLYEKKHPKYRDRKEKREKWNEISSTMKKSEQECAKLWNGLRGQYSRYLAKQRNPSGSGSTSTVFFKHSTLMAFLYDIIEPQTTSRTNLDKDEDKSEHDHKEFQITDSNLIIVVEDVEKLSEDPNVGALHSFPAQLPTVPRSKPQEEERIHKKFTNKRKLDAFDKEILSIMKTEDDEFDAYAKSLASKFRKISDANVRVFLALQNKINLAVNDAEFAILD